jgi:hypothetical protein
MQAVKPFPQLSLAPGPPPLFMTAQVGVMLVSDSAKPKRKSGMSIFFIGRLLLVHVACRRHFGLPQLGGGELGPSILSKLAIRPTTGARAAGALRCLFFEFTSPRG